MITILCVTMYILAAVMASGIDKNKFLVVPMWLLIVVATGILTA